jgi:hypothetical protein
VVVSRSVRALAFGERFPLEAVAAAGLILALFVVFVEWVFDRRSA